MYHQFNIQQLYVLPTQCNYVFCIDLRTNSDHFPLPGVLRLCRWRTTKRNVNNFHVPPVIYCI